MQRHGWTVAQVARHANVSTERVRRRLVLLDLLLDVQKLVRAGQLPLGHAELLGGLDTNRQLIALRVFTAGRSPTLAEFRRICGELSAQQGQAELFDLESYYRERLAEVEGPAAEPRRPRVPRDPKLPRIAIPRTGGEASTVGQAIRAYADQLRAHGLDEQALTVSTMLDDLLDSYWTTL
jgi:ParB-like chromosome segregation protein Spo0J